MTPLPEEPIWCPAIRSEIERQIAEKIVRDALAYGFSISVNDGEQTTLTRSRDADEIAKAMATTDEDVLFFHGSETKSIGWVNLLYGNGADLMCDYGDSRACKIILARALALAERFSR